jgi:hypothetical protein
MNSRAAERMNSPPMALAAGYIDDVCQYRTQTHTTLHYT